MTPITPGQCRAARALLRWTQKQLAAAADLETRTVALFETGDRDATPETRDKMRRALQDAGIKFIAKNGGGEGVRLKRSGAVGERAK